MFFKMSVFMALLFVTVACKATSVEFSSESCLTTSSQPIQDISKLSECRYKDSGPKGVCLSAVSAPASQVDRLAKCGKNMVCLPKNMALYGTRLLLQKCTSMIGLEGRCASLVLPEVKDQEAFLPRDVCAEDELCAPCYDPVTGEDTHICTLAPAVCNAGPEDEPYVLECPYDGPAIVDIHKLPACDDCPGTHCLPASRVPDEQKARLTECERPNGAPGYCTPDKSIEAGSMYVPRTCQTPNDMEGRCLPPCLPTIKAQDYGIWQMDCPDGEVCAPCYDPRTLEDTGACRTAPCDEPAEPPTGIECPYDGPPLVHLDMFEKCDCSDTYCAFEKLVPENQRGLLDPCEDGYCVPGKNLEQGGNYVRGCRALYGMFEGRCQSVCLPSVIEQLDILTQEDCPDGEVCAPCYDPISGEDTQACRGAPCDQPDELKKVFEYCFQDKGRCVPTEIVPEADRADLKQRTCPADTLCVPNELVEDPEYAFPSCEPNGQPGACVPEAVGSLDAIRTTLGRRTCPENHLCVPCNINLIIFNIDTGACR